MQTFLHKNAIQFHKLSIARTYLIGREPSEDEFELIGYFTLSMKQVDIVLSESLSKTKAKRLGGIGANQAILLGQLGRHDHAPELKLGDILNQARPYVAASHQLLGGRSMVLDCEQGTKLRSMYEEQGFMHIGDITNREGVAMHQMCIPLSKYLG